MNSRNNSDTLPDFGAIASAVVAPVAESAQVSLEIGALTDQGKMRPNNEDHFLVVRFGRAFDTLMTNLCEGEIPEHFAEIGYGLVVADGMGGASAGEIASSLAIIAGVNLALNNPKWTLVMTPDEIRENMERWRKRFRQIDSILTECAKSNPSLTGMGTTLTVACSIGPHLLLYYVGDSRAYLFRQGRLHRLTRDHTHAQALADLGRITPEEATRHHMRHVLTRVVGTGGGKVEVEMEYLRLADGDQVLICTDGLTDLVADDQIADVLRSMEPAQASCRSLVDLALGAGGKDNVTVVLARYNIAAASIPLAPRNVEDS